MRSERATTTGRDLAVLDVLRGLAALYVMLGHAFLVLFAAAPTGEVDSVLAYATRQFFRWGHQAVLLFFLISGFCIHYRQAARLTSTPRIALRQLFDVGSYARRRFRRLFPPLAVGLLLTVAFDSIGSRIAPALYQGHTQYAAINQHLGGGSRDVVTFIGNLAFQSSFLVAPFGSNGPLWSLAFEFWFYLMYPLLVVVTARFGARAMVGVAAASSVGGFVVLPQDVPMPGSNLIAYQQGWVPWWIPLVLLYWSVWVWGAVIAEAYVGRARLLVGARAGVVAAVTLALLAIMSGRAIQLPGGWRLYDLGFAAALAVLLAYVMLRGESVLGRVSRAIADRGGPLGHVSYSLYVVHLPWLTLLSASWLSAHRQLPAGGELVTIGAITSLLLAAASWYCVERHFVSRQRDPLRRSDVVVSPGYHVGALEAIDVPRTMPG